MIIFHRPAIICEARDDGQGTILVYNGTIDNDQRRIQFEILVVRTGMSSFSICLPSVRGRHFGILIKFRRLRGKCDENQSANEIILYTREYVRHCRRRKLSARYDTEKNSHLFSDNLAVDDDVQSIFPDYK